MPGWGRPLAGYLVSDPPLGDFEDRRSRGIQVHHPRDPFGPKVFPSDWNDPKPTRTRLTRARITDMVAEVWVRPDAGTRLRYSDQSAEVWTRLFRPKPVYLIDSKSQGPGAGPYEFRFIASETFQTIRYDPPPPPPTVAVYIEDDRYRPKKLDGIGRGPYGLRETSSGRFGPSPISPIVPTINLRFTILSAEVWVQSDLNPRLAYTANTAEVFITSDRNPWARYTDQTGEVWTRLSAVPPAGATYTFLWVD